MTITGRTLFVDTNVLVSTTDRGRRHHERALRLFAEVARHGGHLAWSGQVVREYLVVATRPVAVNGLGLSPERALENVDRFSAHLRLLEENTSTVATLQLLVARHSLAGRRIHDAGLVATMLAHQLTICVSDDATDFQAFDEIQVVDSGLGS